MREKIRGKKGCETDIHVCMQKLKWEGEEGTEVRGGWEGRGRLGGGQRDGEGEREREGQKDRGMERERERQREREGRDIYSKSKSKQLGHIPQS